MTTAFTIVFSIIGLLFGGGLGFYIGFNRRQALDEQALARAEQEISRQKEEARGEATRIRQDAEQAAQLYVTREQERFEQDTARTRTLLEQELERNRVNAEREVNRAREELEREVSRTREELTREVDRTHETLNRDRKELKDARDDLKRDRDDLKRDRGKQNAFEERLNSRAEQQDARANKLDTLERELGERSTSLKTWEETLTTQQQEIEHQLYEVAGMTKEQATEVVFKKLDKELEREKAVLIRAQLEKADAEAKRKATNIITQAIQRSASEVSASVSVSVVPIPNDAMKGRIIGREGRNIRAFESLTGVDLIIDDTPEAVLLSSFNPIRREIARLSLVELVADGRIHPARIEELVLRSQQDMQHYIRERGEEAALEANVVGLKPGMLQLLGRMHFRTSYGQNVLKHSVQVAHLTGIMAVELGLDEALARRSGLLHDIGKSIDREIEGTHTEIGANLARRFGEGEEIIDAIANHHDLDLAKTLYPVIVASADAISAARPGARRESLESYLRRLDNLEAIATSFPGVINAYAIQAGREIRVLVEPDQVDDASSVVLARDVANRIEQDVEYPGQVQVTVVRESRVVEYAR